ncbi:Cell wall endopeptidase, family M23/M37 [Mucinivorans hirudinis]|uniref:Cell wall endopeptidase, family M23/M37 n=1 Tax=Mucinivorans hirudinis TaxID=1433126 RepID=A0A060R7S7_9BACT|nr:Cell wall endopeptidase, family M23/M37 [Mucinivorans hirudinis]
MNPNYIRTMIKWLFRLLWGAGIAVVYYLVLSLFFDTPIEHEIKIANRKLAEQYATLSSRYDSLYSVMENVSARDNNIHKMLFEAEPYSPAKDSTNIVFEIADLQNRSNTELGDDFIERVGLLSQRVYNVNSQIESTLKFTEQNRAQANATPAIQPVVNPDFSLLTASFGNRIHPFYKSMRHHPGVDFSLPEGTAVFATADGVVSEINLRGQNTGISVKIKHDNRFDTFYGNLEKVLVTNGQRVKRGEVIAFSGNSGLSFAPHLHYEVRLRGKAVDPLDYFFLDVDVSSIERLRKTAAAGMQAFD